MDPSWYKETASLTRTKTPPMQMTVLDVTKQIFASTHRRLLNAVEDLADEELARRPTPGSHSIGFELWHAARANDAFAVLLSKMTPALRERLGTVEQIWMSEALAEAWHLDPARLGPYQSGTGMSDEDAAAVQLPAKRVLVDYARRAFAAAEAAVDAVDDRDAVTVVPSGGKWPGDQTVVWYILFYYGHDDWVLGYISALRRTQGLKRVES